MQAIQSIYFSVAAKIQKLDVLPLLLLRIFLAPIFIMAGYGKLQLGNADAGFLQRLGPDSGTVWWFENTLNMPAPELMAFLAGWGELLGGWLLLFGLFTRLSSLVLIVTMVVAATTAHWDKGWHALPETTLTMPWEWRGDLIDDAVNKRTKAREILKEHGNYKWLTSSGSITVLKNGIEFAATYALMLLVTLIYGGGRYLSLDYWLTRNRAPG